MGARRRGEVVAGEKRERRERLRVDGCGELTRIRRRPTALQQRLRQGELSAPAAPAVDGWVGSPVEAVFGGAMLQTVSAVGSDAGDDLDGRRLSRRSEPFYDLSLPIPKATAQADHARSKAAAAYAKATAGFGAGLDSAYAGSGKPSKKERRRQAQDRRAQRRQKKGGGSSGEEGGGGDSSDGEDDGAAEAAAAADHCEVEMNKIYARCNPEKLGDVPALVLKYAGKERQLLNAIYKKYNVPLGGFSSEDEDDPGGADDDDEAREETEEPGTREGSESDEDKGQAGVAGPVDWRRQLPAVSTKRLQLLLGVPVSEAEEEEEDESDAEVETEDDQKDGEEEGDEDGVGGKDDDAELVSLPRLEGGGGKDQGLLSCLEAFTAPEPLAGDNQYRCDDGVDRDAELRLMLRAHPAVAGGRALPAVLTLHLKRFSQAGRALRKYSGPVGFGLELDVAPYCLHRPADLPHDPDHFRYRLH